MEKQPAPKKAKAVPAATKRNKEATNPTYKPQSVGDMANGVFFLEKKGGIKLYSVRENGCMLAILAIAMDGCGGFSFLFREEGAKRRGRDLHGAWCLFLMRCSDKGGSRLLNFR